MILKISHFSSSDGSRLMQIFSQEMKIIIYGGHILKATENFLYFFDLNMMFNQSQHRRGDG